MTNCYELFDIYILLMLNSEIKLTFKGDICDKLNFNLIKNTFVNNLLTIARFLLKNY